MEGTRDAAAGTAKAKAENRSTFDSKVSSAPHRFGPSFRDDDEDAEEDVGGGNSDDAITSLKGDAEDDYIRMK